MRSREGIFAHLNMRSKLNSELLTHSSDEIAALCTGESETGKFRIAWSRASDTEVEYRINDYLHTYKKFMVFRLVFSHHGSVTCVVSVVDWYATNHVGTDKGRRPDDIVGYEVYLRFLRAFAERVQELDPAATVSGSSRFGV